MPDGAGDFRMMNRKMINAVIAMSEVQRFSKGIFSWVGFKTRWISFENVERAAGETKWSFWKLFKYALDGITAFSTAPLKICFGYFYFYFSFYIFYFYNSENPRFWNRRSRICLYYSYFAFYRRYYYIFLRNTWGIYRQNIYGG